MIRKLALLVVIACGLKMGSLVVAPLNSAVAKVRLSKSVEPRKENSAMFKNLALLAIIMCGVKAVEFLLNSFAR